ncbi:MAG: AbgT family transporter [Deltaproteobacteria bacterium]|nr:AbgT family transporter [Deltaproteobacteria bacterium]
MTRRKLTMWMLDGVERVGNKLPHPFWLFCYLVVIVIAVSAGMAALGVSVERPETQLLTEQVDGRRVNGRLVEIGLDGEGITVNLGAASHNPRLSDLHIVITAGDAVVVDTPIDRSELADLHIDTDAFAALQPGRTYRVHVVNQAEQVPVRSLMSREGLTWFVLSMVTNFAEFEPLGLVLVMLMGVAIAEGSGLIPTAMRGIALAVPDRMVIPVMFALGACGNVGSDAGIVVIPPLSAAIFKQMGHSPIAGLLVGYVGATAGFTANFLPAGTDVLAMSLTNAATGSDPEVNVFCNWYFMSASVVFLAAIGTWVTLRFTLPRVGDAGVEKLDGPVGGITALEKRALGIAVIAVVVAIGLWLLTVVPSTGLLRTPDPDPALVWRSPFFKGLVPILFTIFAVGGVAYGLAAGTIKQADDIIEYMTDSMRRMGAYIVLILVISQFMRMFQWANLDQLIAIEGASLLRAMGMESFPVPFFVAFIIIVALANLFMGSASAKWAIFAPIFVPMFMGLGLHPAFTQLLYRLGDSITNCVSPLYPFFPILLGWIADIDPEKAKVGTVLSYLVPYASFLLVGWVIMMVLWYLAGIPVGPDSPLML